MKKNIISTTLLFISTFALLSCGEKTRQVCDIKEVKTLFTTIGIHGKDTGYCHYALIKGMSRNCLDSTMMVNVALKYIDTVMIGKPVDVIMFFNSDKNFIIDETSQDIKEINKSCMVVIGFDEKNSKPNDFIFYNEKGERTYWGKSWQPEKK